MAIPVYLFLTDDSGNAIKGSVDVHTREGSVEVLGIHHSINIPTDDLHRFAGPHCVCSTTGEKSALLTVKFSVAAEVRDNSTSECATRASDNRAVVA